MIIYRNGRRDVNQIALTFDDGPNPFWTPKILEVLDEYGIKATFFVLGKWAQKYREIVKETFNRGHLIGNHTYSHFRIRGGDFEKAEEIIFNIIGRHSQFVRPPYLSIRLCKNYAPAVAKEVKVVTGIMAGDWKDRAENIKRSVLRQVQNGSIIIFHDGSQHEKELKERPSEMFKVLPGILEELKPKFKIIRLDEFVFE